MASPLSGIKAYQDSAALKGLGGGNNAESITGKKDFKGLLQSSLQDGIDTMKHAETLGAGAVMGTTNPIDLVTAVTEADTTLQTIVAVRDKLVTAFDRVFNMAI